MKILTLLSVLSVAGCVKATSPSTSENSTEGGIVMPREVKGSQKRVQDCSLFIDKVSVGSSTNAGKEIKYYIKTKNIDVKAVGFHFFSYSYSKAGYLYEIQAGQGIGRLEQLVPFAGVAKDYFESTRTNGAIGITSDVSLNFKTVGSFFADLQNGDRLWLSNLNNEVAEPFVFDLKLANKILGLQNGLVDGKSYSPETAIFTKDSLPELNPNGCQ